VAKPTLSKSVTGGSSPSASERSFMIVVLLLFLNLSLYAERVGDYYYQKSYSSENDSIDWYKTQFGTGQSNCGPAVASMAIAWARNIDTKVEDIRKRMGFNGLGETSFDDITRTFRAYKVNYSIMQISTIQHIINLLLRNRIVIILYDTNKIKLTLLAHEKNYFGRYYFDKVYHFSIVKGYTFDNKYFIMYDPMPSDWDGNTERYSDGSMLGKNRYYSSSEVIDSLKTNEVIVVSR
jgi:hypothetical protein